METLSEEPKLPEFYPKTPRWNDSVVITEKIDGTNAGIYRSRLGTLHCCSRNRWLTPEKDNYGFCRWVTANAEDLLVELPIGMHFGEWWGHGIQRHYDMKEKVFSLFNTDTILDQSDTQLVRKVPVIVRSNGELTVSEAITRAVGSIGLSGSCAANGFSRPEGLIVDHHGKRFKIIINAGPK